MRNTNYEAPYCATVSTFLLLFPPNILFTNTLSLCSFHRLTDQVPQSYKTTGKIIHLQTGCGKAKDLKLNHSKHSLKDQVFWNVECFTLLTDSYR
jgi:hypothetical protein